MVKLQNAAFDSATKGLQKVLEKFLREDVKQMKDTKGYFNKISGDLDTALAKNAAASKNKPSEVDDASNVLTATRSCFRYTTLDYVYQISMIQSKKGHEVLASLAKYFMQSPFSICCTTQPPWRNLVQESRDRQILFEVKIYLQKGFSLRIKGCILYQVKIVAA